MRAIVDLRDENNNRSENQKEKNAWDFHTYANIISESFRSKEWGRGLSSAVSCLGPVAGMSEHEKGILDSIADGEILEHLSSCQTLQESSAACSQSVST
jgi:hypothetical protein